MVVPKACHQQYSSYVVRCESLMHSARPLVVMQGGVCLYSNRRKLRTHSRDGGWSGIGSRGSVVGGGQPRRLGSVAPLHTSTELSMSGRLGSVKTPAFLTLLFDIRHSTFRRPCAKKMTFLHNPQRKSVWRTLLGNCMFASPRPTGGSNTWSGSSVGRAMD